MLELVPPHFSSSYWWEAIIERTKGYGGPVVVESVYVVDEVLMKLSYVAETVFLGCYRDLQNEEPENENRELQSLKIIRIALMFVQPTFDAITYDAMMLRLSLATHRTTYLAPARPSLLAPTLLALLLLPRRQSSTFPSCPSRRPLPCLLPLLDHRLALPLRVQRSPAFILVLLPVLDLAFLRAVRYRAAWAH